MTLAIVTGTVINIYSDLVAQRVCQDLDTFALNVVVQRHAGDLNRLDILFPADFVDQLNVVPILIQFQSYFW